MTRLAGLAEFCLLLAVCTAVYLARTPTPTPSPAPVRAQPKPPAYIVLQVIQKETK